MTDAESSQHDREDARCPECGNTRILELHCEHCGHVPEDSALFSQEPVNKSRSYGLQFIAIAVVVYGLSLFTSSELAIGAATAILVIAGIGFLLPGGPDVIEWRDANEQ